MLLQYQQIRRYQTQQADFYVMNSHIYINSQDLRYSSSNIIGLSMKNQEVECFYKSFEGAGSLYIGKESAFKTMDLLNRYTIRAIVVVSQSKISSYPNNLQILCVPAQERDPSALRGHFESCFYFIDKHRLKTNILICSSGGSNISVAYMLAYLMKKYKYELSYVCRIFHQNLRTLDIPEDITQQLQKISIEFEKEKEEDDGQELSHTYLGKRIIRIRKEYGSIAASCRSGSLTKRTCQKVNPEYLTLKTQFPSKDLNSKQLKEYRSTGKGSYGLKEGPFE